MTLKEKRFAQAIGSRLLIWRQAAGYNLVDVERLTSGNVLSGMLCKWEAGVHMPRIPLAMILCELYGKSLDDLVY